MSNNTPGKTPPSNSISSNPNSENSIHFYLSSLNHEIRTPLNGIVGYSQLLSQTRLDANQSLYVKSINHCCIQLMELVNDILDFSKLITGKVAINNQCFTLNEIVEEINITLGYRINEKKQKIYFTIDKTIPEYIISDKVKIIQILINLISNANKFTKKGGRIIVSVDPIGKDTLSFSVEDNGIGISEENQKKLFVPFFQIRGVRGERDNRGVRNNAIDSKMPAEVSSFEKNSNGFGLGLAISKKLVELLKGEIIVESKENEGSVFRFTLPYQNYTDFNNIKLLKNKYILLLIENLDDRIIISDILFNHEMKVITISNIKEMNRMISRYPFSVLFLDSDLFREVYKKETNIPQIFYGRLDRTENNVEVIEKPLNELKLVDTILRCIKSKDISSLQLNEVVNTENKDNKETEKEIKILIAEDVGYNLDMLMKMLNSLGYNNITGVSDGEEAIDKIKESNYDILFLDLKMPKVDGFEVAQYIRDQKVNTKIAVISASILENDRERCKELNVKYFILKPFSMTQLKTVLQKLIYGTIKED